MKFANPTRYKTYLRCPKRYYYRYLHEPNESHLEEHGLRGRLFGVRELGGHLIHRGAAEMVRAIADDDRTWNYESSGREYQEIFLLIVAKSLAAAPGEFIEGLQLAETYNGANPTDIRDDVNYWKELIPIAIEHAWRAAHPLRLHDHTAGDLLEAEREVRWYKGGEIVHCKFDVLAVRKYQVIVIDWKTHEIDNADLYQVRHYLDYLRVQEKVPVSKLSGFAVDLRNEDIVPVTYDPYRLRGSASLASTLLGTGGLSGSPRNPFPAKPHLDLCLSCPYAAMCPDAIVTPAAVICQPGMTP